MEYPFAVAVKTGTSQNYRDAWTMAFSHKYVVGVWIGRADAGAMRNLTGASSAARLSHAILTYLHKSRPGENLPEEFAPPPERISIDLCSAKAQPECPNALKEWVKPNKLHSQIKLNSPAPDHISGLQSFEKILITAPEDETHIWRNPNQPERFNRLPLKLTANSSIGQILWIIDGEPFMTAQADETVYWPMKPGHHLIQARLALASVYSQRINITIE
jgi:penicillin-binding protein 1C